MSDKMTAQDFDAFMREGRNVKKLKAHVAQMDAKAVNLEVELTRNFLLNYFSIELRVDQLNAKGDGRKATVESVIRNCKRYFAMLEERQQDLEK